MYRRNRIYITEEQQEKLRNVRVLIGGAGLGSVISECLLRLGVVNFIIVDFDKVEISNLNRQNYTSIDIGEYKVESLSKRLKSINPEVNVRTHNICLDETNFPDYMKEFDIAINTLDFTSGVPFEFDNYCIKHEKPVIHPYNLGWASCVFIINQQSQRLSDILTGENKPEVDIVEFILRKKNSLHSLNWLKVALAEYLDENNACPPPQLAVASWITAGMCAKIVFDILAGHEIKTFPEFYFNTV